MANVLSDSQKALISSFLEIAVGQSAGTAREFLQATNWNLGEAIQRFFSGNDIVAAEAEVASMVNNSSHWESDDDDDVRRRPLPVKREVFYGENSGLNSDSDEIEQISDNNALAILFRPPYELLYEGPFDSAKQAGIERNKWLLVNVQSKGEFASKMLNRDTWADKIVAQMIKNNFVFWQEDCDTEEGRKVCCYYKLNSTPVVLVIDPITGQKLRFWNGMVEPETLLEDAMAFIDRTPSEYHSNIVKKQRERRKIKITRDEIEEADDEENKEIVYPPLPEEPKGNRNLFCRIAIRLPDGRRIQRNFLKTDSIKLLWSFCSTQLEETETRPFRFKQLVMPGKTKFWTTNYWDYDSNLTFEDSGLNNSVISVLMI